MQVKYIVYYPAPNSAPRVALWLTSDGSMIHAKYAEEHHIQPQSYSSLGYAYYSPFSNKYKLEHYSCQEAFSFSEFIKRKQIEVRDRRLVLQEIEKNSMLKNPHIQQGTYKDWVAFLKAQQNYRAC